MPQTTEAEKARAAAYRAANREKKAAYDAAYRAANREKLAAQKAAYGATYRAANREKLAAQKAAYRAANKEKIAAYHAAYHAAHKEKKAAYHEAYREANRQKVAAYRRAHYEANKEKHAAQVAAWKAANPEKVRAAAATRRAREVAAAAPLTDADKALLVTIYAACPEGWHVDHRQPLAAGGLHVPDNLWLLPAAVNLAKRDSFDPLDPTGIRWALLALERVGFPFELFEEAYQAMRARNEASEAAQ